MIKSIDNELALHEKFIDIRGVEVQPNKIQLLASLGALLRKYSAPFSNSHGGHLHVKNDQHSSWSENQYNARVAIIYSWVVLTFFGLLLYFFLASTLNKIFNNFNNAIERISKHKLNEKIPIQGPLELRKISFRLNNLRLQMSQEKDQQRNFLSHISHQIKTPLTSIIEGSKLLDEQRLGSMNREQQEIANILVRSSSELQRSIENLLDYNASIALKNAATRRRLDLSNLVNQALDNNQLLIRQKKLSIDKQLESVFAKVHSDQLISVFDNLISNAIKHSPEEGLITLKLTNKQAGLITFLIQDQGEGIEEHHTQFIFDPFYAGPQAKQTTLKGTGLGLSIAKQYVNDHNGKIELLKNNKGARFKITLPSN